MLSPAYHRYIFLFGVCSLAFGMMMGTVPTSVPQIILMANWLLEGRFAEKWSLLKHNKLFWLLSAVFLMHVLGLFYTTDLTAGGNDVRTKMPMMFLPLLFFSTPPLNKKELQAVLSFFLLGCLANTAWCLTYTHVLHQNEGVRNASRFMSHIRLGLYLNIAIAVCVYLWRDQLKGLKRFGLLFFALYFLFCMYALGLASGMANFILLVFFTLCFVIYRQALPLKISFFVVLFLFMGSVIWYINKIAMQQLHIREGVQNIPTEKTPWGSSYIHFETQGQIENGNYVLINIELQELRRGWNRRAPGDTFSFVPEHNLKRYEVLVRYLASKGVNKDSLGVAQLSEDDIANIRRDVFNVDYPNWSFFHRRIYELVNEYDEFNKGSHVNGQSITMRPYFWKAAIYAIQQHPLIGSGTGDVQTAMNAAYKATQSPLHEEWYKRPHNQFLTITLAVGVVGLLLFLLSIFVPAFQLRHELPALYWVFFCVVLISFLMEDTLETQAGQTFYAFFNSLFIAQAYHAQKFTQQD